MCVLAGAGTGKTRAITHRIAYGVHSGAYQAQRVLAVTFTARAAGEMRTRLRGLGAAGVQARTFHAAALRQLHFFWPQAVGGAAPEVLPYKAPVVAEAASRLRMQFDRTAIRDLAAEVEWAKVSLLTPETYAARARAAGRDPAGIDLREMARLFETYEECKTQRGVMDFEDVLLLTAGILAEREEIARTVRGQYRHFVVDEYQDVNALQQRLLDLWVGERDDVCVVGDPAQTIYSFTGASPQHLLRFPRRHPTAPVVRLVRNYRSTPQIVGLANLVSRRPGRRVHERGRRRRRSGAPRTATAGYVELVAGRPAGPAPSLTPHPDDPAEADAVAAEIARLVGGGHPAAEIAVLMRTNAPVRGARVGAGRRRRALPRTRRRAVLRAGRGAPRRAAAAGRRPQRRRLRAPARPRARRPRPAPGGHPSRPEQRRRRARAVGVAHGARDPGRRPRRRVAAGPGAPTSCATSTSGSPRSTRPPCRASRSRRCTRPRAWSGTPSSSSAAATGSSPSPWPRAPRPSRRSAACSTSG